MQIWAPPPKATCGARLRVMSKWSGSSNTSGSRFAPCNEVAIGTGRKEAAGVDGVGVAEGDVPEDGIDLGAGLIGEGEEVVEPLGGGKGDVAVVGGVELDADATARGGRGLG